MQIPGDFIKDLLNQKGWTQADLAKILCRPLPTVNHIIKGKKTITPEMAVSLGAAFGNDPEWWMKIESEYRLSLTKTNPKHIKKRAFLYEYAPIKDMERRRWIPKTESPEEQEKVLCQFYGINSLEEKPQLTVATRKSLREEPLTSSQEAWCYRAKQLAKAIHVSPFKKSKLKEASLELRKLAAYPEETSHVSKTLAEYGIRFLVIEPLPGGKIDGATLWLDEQSPVIIVSLRYDRIDNFWFTLFHEFYHVVNEDASVDDDLCGESQRPSIVKTNAERKADLNASERLVPSEKLDSFIMRVSPLYSKKKIIQFAHTVKIHPGIIVGQLQCRGEIGFSANREMLVRIRNNVTNTALTDGWGHNIEVNFN